MKNNNKIVRIIIKSLISIGIVIVGIYSWIVTMLITSLSSYLNSTLILIMISLIIFLIVVGVIALIWKFSKKRMLVMLSLIGVMLVMIGINAGIKIYDNSLKVNVTPNINVYEYLPFREDSKIVKLDSKYKLNGELPIVDGAAAVFPVYSAFINSIYPDTTELYDGVFEYNNTTNGYELLAEKKTDIFFGAYPSEEQIAYAKEQGTEFEFIEIGKEAFVFFVHKDNPVDNLTADQIRQIYSGEITNWSEVGGRNEKIVAYQRNEGSGSQSMLKRFMGSVDIIEAPTEQVNDLMVGIIDKVADYKSTTASIGFSFRYYVEGIIKNPNIKVIAIDGIAPTIENIQNNSYGITTPLYAVITVGEENKNVKAMIDWVLSDEGQYIIEETGYIPIK